MIYLDNNATTRIDDLVFDSMLPFLKEDYANASSTQHKMGRRANQAVEEARLHIAATLQVNSKEIFFTSGSTESINMVLRGVYERYQSIGNHIITCQTEHKAVLTTCAELEKKGAKITYLPVDKNGGIDLEELKKNINPETILVTIMSANNETGIVHPIQDIAEICKSRNVLFFSDCTQSLGKQFFNLETSEIDICCFSAHKFHGPKGIGILFIRRKSRPIQIAALITGGNQENQLRGGTYNVPAIVGMGKAISLLPQTDLNAIANLRDYFEDRIIHEIEDCEVNGAHSPRIVNTSNIHFKHVRSSELMTRTIGIAVSSGSACVSGDRDPSHVLRAMHYNDERAFCSVRFSLSKYTTKTNIDQVVEQLKTNIKSIRDQSPVWQMYKSGLLE